MQYKPYPYQDHSSRHIIDNPASGLFMEMGLGKTVSTATALNELIYDRIEISKPLIIAPKRVAESVWTDEIEKWDHLKHLTVSQILGTERQRKEALLKRADIYIINVENVAWLVAHYGTGFPFDMLILDESSKFKNHKSIRFRCLKAVRPKVKRVVLLTGTPTPNGLLDLWAPLYLLDQGERLEPTISKYREKYFTEGRKKGHIVYNYELKEDDWMEDRYSKLIYRQVSDICLSMKAEDYLVLPKRIDRTILITMEPKTKARYDEFEKKQILALEDAEDISVVNAAALTNKLLQFANGAVYDDDKTWHEVHREKIAELEEILDINEGKPVLVFYSFKSDLERIQQILKKYKPQILKGPETLKEWNARKIPFLLAHPASAGHGLNMQAGGNIVVWFGLNWSLELYQQGVARLDRQGQTERVINHRMAIKDTMDEDVLAALERKLGGQEALMAALKARIRKVLG